MVSHPGHAAVGHLSQSNPDLRGICRASIEKSLLLEKKGSRAMKTRSGKRLCMTGAAIEAAHGRPAKRRSGSASAVSVPVLCDMLPVQPSKKQRKMGKEHVHPSRGSPFDALPVSLLLRKVQACVLNILLLLELAKQGHEGAST